MTKEEKLQKSVFFVEANSFEQLCLWQENKDENWIQDYSGFSQYIGSINDDEEKPVWVEFSFNDILGHKVCFYSPTSRYVDNKMIREYLETNYPKTWDDGKRQAFTNSMNFHHVLNHIRTLNKQK